jgi:gliding motility-associated-like protein
MERSDIQVPNAFTPNGDGLNDYLKPIGMGVTEIRFFRIFNRWGQLVYESGDLKTGWDGTFKGQPQSSQSFAWMVEGIGQDGTLIQKKGSSTLIR